MEPTYDELLQIVESLQDRVKDLEKAGAEKDKRIDKLEKNSTSTRTKTLLLRRTNISKGIHKVFTQKVENEERLSVIKGQQGDSNLKNSMTLMQMSAQVAIVMILKM